MYLNYEWKEEEGGLHQCLPHVNVELHTLPTHRTLLPAHFMMAHVDYECGQRIIKKLLSLGVDMNVVTFVRDKKKLERILYEEEDLVMGNLVETGNGAMKNDDGGGKKKRHGAPVVRVFRQNVAK